MVYLSISYRTVSKYRLSEIYRISNTFRYGFRYRYRYDNIEKFDTIYNTSRYGFVLSISKLKLPQERGQLVSSQESRAIQGMDPIGRNAKSPKSSTRISHGLQNYRGLRADGTLRSYSEIGGPYAHKRSECSNTCFTPLQPTQRHTLHRIARPDDATVELNLLTQEGKRTGIDASIGIYALP